MASASPPETPTPYSSTATTTRGGPSPGARRGARGPRGAGRRDARRPRAPRAARAASLPRCPGARRGIPRSACARGRGPCFFLARAVPRGGADVPRRLRRPRRRARRRWTRWSPLEFQTSNRRASRTNQAAARAVQIDGSVMRHAGGPTVGRGQSYVGKNRLGKPVLILYEGERVLSGGRRINKPPQNGFGGGSETLGAALRWRARARERARGAPGGRTAGAGTTSRRDAVAPGRSAPASDPARNLYCGLCQSARGPP